MPLTCQPYRNSSQLWFSNKIPLTHPSKILPLTAFDLGFAFLRCRCSLCSPDPSGPALKSILALRPLDSTLIRIALYLIVIFNLAGCGGHCSGL